MVLEACAFPFWAAGSALEPLDSLGARLGPQARLKLAPRKL